MQCQEGSQLDIYTLSTTAVHIRLPRLLSSHGELVAARRKFCSAVRDNLARV